MQDLINQFKALTKDEKLAFMKEAMPELAKSLENNPQNMMAEMMPICMNVMKSMNMQGTMPDMQGMMKTMMGMMGGMGANKG